MTDRLPPELEALLDFERQAPEASAAAKARVLERLESTLGLGPDGGDGGNGGDGGPQGSSPQGALQGSGMGATGSVASASASSSLLPVVAGAFGGKVALGGWAAGIAALSLTAGLFVGGLQGERELASIEPAAIAEQAPAAAAPPAGRESIAAETNPAAALPAVTAAPAPDDELFVIEEADVTVRSVPRAPPAARAEPAAAPTASPSRLADEQAFLDAARAQLAVGDVISAERTLRRHEQRFSGGVLEEERTALLVLALARAGDTDAAARTAAAFRVRWPDSLHLGTVEAALEELR